MKSNQLLPFERNRYYVGKLLTSADFQAEQIYGANKRHFLNEMMFGNGVVCGLGVYSLDDQSIMLDSGVALDSDGREIVVESSVVRKLAAIKGFEELEGNLAVVCLRYKEEDVHPVYTVGGQNSGENYECNRVREGWELVLRDEASLPLSNLESEFLIHTQFYEDSDYSIMVSVPAIASCGNRLKLDVTITAKSDHAADLTLNAEIQAPAFFGENGEHALSIHMEMVSPEMGQSISRSFWLTAQTMPVAESLLIAGVEANVIKIGEQRNQLKENFTLRLAVVDSSPRELVARAAGRISLESYQMANVMSEVPLAVITLQRTKKAYIIEKIDEETMKHYVETVAGARLRAQYKQYYAGSDASITSEPRETSYSVADAGMKYQEPNYATGICEMPISGSRKGQLVYSSEVIHGLGRGNVIVHIGFEYLTEDKRGAGQSRNTIYGDVQLFKDENTSITNANTAVKVFNDKGSFVVAAQLQQDALQAVMVLRWVAVKLPAANESLKIQGLSGKSIAAEQPTVVLATRESHYVNVKFKNMEPCTLTYELSDPNSGEITSDGIYTAPGKEGVYEIRIYCEEVPLVSTYAYAVVKKRTAEQEEKA